MFTNRFLELCKFMRVEHFQVMLSAFEQSRLPLEVMGILYKLTFEALAMAVTTKSPMLLSRQRKRGRESRMRSCISSKWTTITRQVAKRRFGEESTNGHCTSKVHKHGFFHIKTQIIMTYGIKLPGVCAGRAPKGANTVQASVHGHRKGPQGNVTGQNDLLYIRLPSTQESAKVLDGRILCTSIYMYLRH